MLGVWIEQGEEELVKAMEETLVFPQAEAAVLSGCARMLTGKPDSNIWDEVSAMITALCENKLVTKADIGAEMATVAQTCFHSDKNRLDLFGEFFSRLAVKNLYTLEQLCKATDEISTASETRYNLIRVCMGRMVQVAGLDFTREYFWGPHNHALLQEYFGDSAFNDKLLVDCFVMG